VAETLTNKSRMERMTGIRTMGVRIIRVILRIIGRYNMIIRGLVIG
jgi:hypothetical protein